MSGAERLDVGVAFEQTVRDQLRRAGWRPEPFGVGLLSPTARARLRATASTARWLPDLLVWRNAGQPVFVDAKWTAPGHDRHPVEVSSAWAAVGFEGWSSIDEWFVFPDGCVVRPAVVMAQPRELAHGPGGSGTPYVFVSCSVCERWSSVFGGER